MTDTNKLKQILVGEGLTQAKAAELMGISLQSFNMKLNNKREFSVKEIKSMTKLFNIKNPYAIFFATDVDLKSTKIKEET